MPIVKPIDKISNDIKTLQSDIEEIKKLINFIKDYISQQEESRKGWFYYKQLLKVLPSTIHDVFACLIVSITSC